MVLLRRVFASFLVLNLVAGSGNLSAYAATVPTVVLPPAQVTILPEAACFPCVITDGVVSIVSAVSMFFPANSPGIAGMPVYNSANLAPSVWGIGWISDMDHYATIDAGGSVTVVGGSGTRLKFTKTGVSGDVPSYRGPLGTNLTLTATIGAGGAVTSLTERDSDGTSLLFGTPTAAEVGGEPLAPGAVSALRLTRLTDRNGSTIDYKRDSQGRLNKVQDIHGRYFTMTYNPAGQVATLADSGGRSVAFVYDATGNKTSETGPEGTTGYTYDTAHHLTRITYPNGGVRNYVYDAQGRMTGQDDGDGVNAVTFTRNANSTVVTDALNRQTTYEYTKVRGFSLITKFIDPDNHEVNLVYDSRLNVTSATDELGRTVNYTYDAQGNLASVRDPAGNVSRAVYEPVFNQPTSMTDPLNRTITLNYDSQGRLTQLRDPLSRQTKFSYDAFGHVTRLEDALQHAVQFAYSASNGALASVTDPLNRTALFQTDALSRVTKVTDPAGKHASFAYDVSGNLASMTDALGGVTALGYQAGRNGKVPIQITDANNHSMAFEYDPVGRLKKATNALGQTASVTYDIKSRLETVTSRRNQLASFTYDNLDRLTQLTTPEGNLTIAYDATGNITSAAKYNGSQVTLTYDTLDRITQEVQTLPGGHAVAFGYTYDANGNRTKMTTPWGAFVYTYDKLDRPTSVTNPSGKTFTFSYDAVGRRTTKTYPNGVQTTYAYDAASQVTQVRHRRISDDSTLAFADYVYDAAGNRLTMTDTAGEHSYVYDNGHRLTQANHPAGSLLPTKNETFSYDPAHNRTTDASITNYVYDAADRLQSNSSFTYTNDADGNRTATTGADGQTQYTWDSSNQLTQVQRPDGVTVGYAYDVMGRMIQVAVTSNTVTTTRFVRDGAEIVATLDGNNNLTGLYTHSGMGREPLALTRGTTAYYLHDDLLSSVVAASDQAGLVVERAEYSAYGQPTFTDQASTATASFIGNVYAYTGAEWAVEIGLSRHGIRYLDVQIGRWISEEPFGFDGTNRYWYAGNNPIKLVDRTGAQQVVDPGTARNAAVLAPLLVPVLGQFYTIGISIAATIWLTYMAYQYVEDKKEKDPEPSSSGGNSIKGFGGRGGNRGKPPRICRPNQKQLEHIVERHWPQSEATGAGKFSNDITARKLFELIDVAVANGTERPNIVNGYKRPGTIIEYTFDENIGIDLNKKPTKSIQIIVRDGTLVWTAYPYSP